jgi:2-amino-4-hydroxy-6-hydroxymethyldihydropteridine diphosphokinase
MTAKRKAWLGLGGNVGDVAAAMGAALRDLVATDAVSRVRVSGLYRTPPWGKTDQPEFLNACAGVETRLDPEALLDACLGAEARLKRVRTEKWGPRTIDIDILAMGGVTQATGRLTVPHPRLTERAFALAPLVELAPDLIVAGKSVAQWLALADRSAMARIAGPEWFAKEG